MDPIFKVNSSEISFQSILGKTQNNIGEIISYGKDDYSMRQSK